MKAVNVWFTDKEHEYMNDIKEKISQTKRKILTWHDFILAGATEMEIKGDEK